MKRAIIEGAIFAVIAGCAAHLLYGGLGFCPTDEGYMLSGSRRLLLGQIPHRDYISLRPVGTQFLHAHLLLWTGERLIWWSRLLTWIQVAATSWIWIEIASRFCHPLNTSRLTRFLLATLAFLASTNSFPIMPWNTYDGLSFITLGIAICVMVPNRSWLGVLCIGMSTIFRQNFVFPIPLLLLALGEFRSIRSWILAALPGALYLAVMFATGAFRDMMIQMGSHKGSLLPALLPVVAFPQPFLHGVIIGATGAGAQATSRRAIQFIGNIVMALGFFYAALILPFASGDKSIGWFLFGMLLAVSPRFVRQPRFFRFIMFALITAWGAAISEGHPQPSLISSALYIALACVMIEFEITPPALPRSPGLRTAERGPAPSRTPVFRVALTLSLIMALYSFHRGRVAQINCDLNAEYLTHELGRALPGARGIYSNPNTHDFLLDLSRLTQSLHAEGRRYAVVPECTQFWVTSPQANPLSTDWPIDPELQGEQLMSRVLREVDAIRGSVTFVVQKHWVVNIPFKRDPIRAGESAIVDRIRSACRKTGETEFFELYE